MAPKSRRVQKAIAIRVSSGGCSAKVMAHSLIEAFKLFIDTKKPKCLGLLCEFKTKEWQPGEDTFYMSTIVALEKLDIYSKE
jgi:hypothetical protein